MFLFAFLAFQVLTDNLQVSLSADSGPPSMRPRSYSPRPPPRRSVDAPRVEDVDPARKAERDRQLAALMAAVGVEKAEAEMGEAKEKEFDGTAEYAKLKEGLGVYPICYTSFLFKIVRGQIFSSSTQITLKTRKSTRLSRLTSLRKAHPMISQDQRRAIARMMTKACLEDSYLTSIPIDVSFSRSRKGGY